MERCDQSWNLTNFVTEFDKLCTFFLNLEKFSIIRISRSFPQNVAEARFVQRWSWKIKKWSWKSHEKKICGNPESDNITAKRLAIDSMKPYSILLSIPHTMLIPYRPLHTPHTVRFLYLIRPTLTLQVVTWRTPCTRSPSVPRGRPSSRPCPRGTETSPPWSSPGTNVIQLYQCNIMKLYLCNICMKNDALSSVATRKE